MLKNRLKLEPNYAWCSAGGKKKRSMRKFPGIEGKESGEGRDLKL